MSLFEGEDELTLRTNVTGKGSLDSDAKITYDIMDKSIARVTPNKSNDTICDVKALKYGTTYLRVSVEGVGSTIVKIDVKKHYLQDMEIDEEPKVYNGEPQDAWPTVYDTIVTGDESFSATDYIELTEGKDYTIKYKNNVNAGTATVTATGKGNYTGSISKKFKIKKATGIKVKLKKSKHIYNGKKHTTKLTVYCMTAEGKRLNLKKNKDYTVSYKNNKYAGKGSLTVKGKGNFSGKVTKKLTINKAANPLKVKGKTAAVKRSKVKKSSQKVKVSRVIKTTKKGKGTITYSKVKGNKKITIAKKSGKVTVKKGLKKGTYKVKVKVKAKGTKNYKPKTWTITFRIRVK